MALRQIDILVNPEADDQVIEILKTEQVTQYWKFPGETHSLIKCLVSPSLLESLLDKLEAKHASNPAFRLIIYPVEATIPRMKERTDHRDRNQKKIMRIGREELYQDLTAEAEFYWNFVILIVLSSIVAGVGILQDNVVIIIGAMVIAPLIGPNMALALATTLGDLELAKKSINTLLKGTLLTLAICIVWGYFDSAVDSISQIAGIKYGDLVLALVSGAAGVLAILRGTLSALVGVMIAVALLPPWVKTGFFIGGGYFENAIYSFLIFSVNVISLNLAGILTFLLAGVKPYKWWQLERAKVQTRKALIIWVSLLLLLIVIIYSLEYK